MRSSRLLGRKARRIMLSLLIAPFVCTLSLVAALLVLSPGKPRPYLDANGKPQAGSISEKAHVAINGVQQGMFIRGRDRTNPVLLFLHGGPGMPEYFLTASYPTSLEDHFTVCWWEQRGSGLSYSADEPPETISIEQLVSDTIEVTNYLRQRFGKDKIYLMGHSGGSFVGLQAAARAPELYYAYIGMGQMTYQLKSEELAYEYMLEQFRSSGNTKMAKALEETPVTMSIPLPPSYDRLLRDKAMHSLGIGTTRSMKSVVTGIFLPSWLSREYTIGEKLNIWRGKLLSKRILWNQMLATDLTKQIPELDLPVYFLHGKYDYTASFTEARSYFERLKAPLKGFYTFEQSAHTPLFEEPERVIKILLEDVVPGANILSDTR